MNRKEQVKYGLHNKRKSLFDIMAGRFSKKAETENHVDVSVFGILKADELTAEQINYIKGFYGMKSPRHKVIGSDCLRLERMWGL